MSAIQMLKAQQSDSDSGHIIEQVRPKVDAVIAMFKQDPRPSRESAPAAPAAQPRAQQLPGPPPPPPLASQYGAPQGGGWPAVQQQQQQQALGGGQWPAVVQQQQQQQVYGQQQWPPAPGYPMQPVRPYFPSILGVFYFSPITLVNSLTHSTYPSKTDRVAAHFGSLVF